MGSKQEERESAHNLVHIQIGHMQYLIDPRVIERFDAAEYDIQRLSLANIAIDSGKVIKNRYWL